MNKQELKYERSIGLQITNKDWDSLQSKGNIVEVSDREAVSIYNKYVYELNERRRLERSKLKWVVYVCPVGGGTLEGWQNEDGRWVY